jgi:hypothetical protein
VPKGLKGYVLLNTDRILPAPREERRDQPGDEEEEEEEDEKEEEVKIVEEVASFQQVMVWGHEAIVYAGEDCYVRGVEEWIGFAESVSPPILTTSVNWLQRVSYETWKVIATLTVFQIHSYEETKSGTSDK